MKKNMMLMVLLFLGMMLSSCSKKRNLVSPDEYKDHPIVDNYVLIWGDEFNGNQLDLKKWTASIEGGGGGNNEAQYYKAENVTVKDGNLVLTAKKENYDKKQYTSGKVVSKGKGDFLYGKFEIKAKVPGGRGTWPAIWMMPTIDTYGGWPKSGEIDIMEYVGYDKDKIHGTIHSEKFNHKIGTQLGKSQVYEGVEDKFVVYSIVWEPGTIEWFIDGLSYLKYSYNAAFNQDVPSRAAWPFDHKFYLILNFAVGGDWGGQKGIDESIFPNEFLIDYVRVYQKDFKYADKEKPKDIEEIKVSNKLKNMIYWDVPKDDQGIEEYQIYVDGELQGTSKLNSYILTNLKAGETYKIEVVGIDFAGNQTSRAKLSYAYK